MSPYSSSLANLIRRISWATKVAGFVLFNRYYQPDFDIDHLSVKSADLLSSPAEANFTLRWIALMVGRVECDLVASTGIHDGEGVIKQLLAGATAVQVVSTLYLNGPSVLQNMLNSLEEWMTKHGFNCLGDFRGRLSYQMTDDPAVFERTQFMKYYGGLS
jgi:dihydroorotate dehydrogenase (fumarate)